MALPNEDDKLLVIEGGTGAGRRGAKSLATTMKAQNPQLLCCKMAQTPIPAPTCLHPDQPHQFVKTRGDSQAQEQPKES